MSVLALRTRSSAIRLEGVKANGLSWNGGVLINIDDGLSARQYGL